MLTEKQFKYIKALLKNNTLNKDIHTLTKKEANVVIDGLMHNGKVTNTYNGMVLSEESHKRKQILFDKLVSFNNMPMATKEQIVRIKYLLNISNYEITKPAITSIEAIKVINFLEKNNNVDINTIPLRIKNNSHLVKEKLIQKNINTDLPDDWVIQDIKINGVLNFKQKND